MTPAVVHVFVYGTLMPGDVRWHHVEAHVVALRRDTVRGRLYDTGLDYPGARFDHDGIVHGWILELRPETAVDTLHRLDEIEGTVHGEYRRVELRSDNGCPCWAYEIGTGTEGLRDLDGCWPVVR